MQFYNSTESERLAETLELSKLILPDHLRRERCSANAKWYRYRFMSPLAATRHFAELYRRHLRAHVRRHYDSELAEKVQGLSPSIFSTPSGNLTQLWTARQRADEFGLPYELLIEFGLEFASRRKWKRVPLPVQLFGSKESDVAWPLEFEKFYNERYPAALNRLSDLPQYRTENYRSLVAQEDFRCALFAQIAEAAERWPLVIARNCIETRHLPILQTMRLVPSHLRKGVISEARHDLEIGLIAQPPVERLPEIAYVPSCFGIPAAHDLAADQCASCSFAATCGQLATVAADKMRTAYGSVSPVKESSDSKRREGNRIRQARRRAKLKASATPVTGASASV